MPKLHADEFNSVAPLFSDVQYYAPIPYSVIEGNHPGTIFVDRRKNPTVALACRQCGYYYLAGNPDNVEFRRSLPRLLFDEIEGMDSFYLCAFPVSWEEKLDVILRSPATKGYDKFFDFNPARFSSSGWRDKIPPGFCLKPIDEILIEKIVNQFGGGGIKHFWRSADEFMSKGLGFCLLHGDEIANICWSSFVGDGKCDVSITTVEKFRRRGFATLTASAFIDRCLEKGLTPVWHCDPENLPSNAIARRMGFEEKGVFPMYHCWIEQARKAGLNKLETESEPIC